LRENRRIYGSDMAIIGKELKVVGKTYIKVVGDRIARIYSSRPKNVDEFYEECVMVPGFVNMHTHIADSVGREKAYGLNLEEAVAPPSGLKFKVLESADEEELIYAMRTAMGEMLRRGITTFVDFREGGVEGVMLLRRSLRGLGINAIVLGRPDGSSVEEVLSVADGVGLSSLNRYDGHELLQIAENARSRGKYVAFHASETEAMREKSIKMFGESDIVRGLRLMSPTFVVHATYADRGDLEALAKSGTCVVLCPRANAYFGLGPPPIRGVVELGVPFCLGTDNVMANSPDLFRELDFVVRIARMQGITIEPRRLLASITSLPGSVLGMEIGYIDLGARADFFFFSMAEPNVACMEDPVKAIVLRGSETNIVSVVAGGGRVIFDV